jgi:lysophospholipase L1-like esterase
VYGASAANGCHRSDVSEVLSSEIAVDALTNRACSGAETQNIQRSSNGGVGQGGEPSQADQLADVAASHHVEMIVLSIGGNDLGFANIIITCTVEYNTSPSWWPNTCNGQEQAGVDSRMAAAMAGVATAIDEIHAVMAAAGQPGGYRVVLQSYRSRIQRASEFRYSESGWDRSLVGGCPFWDVDATWARDSLVPQISSNLALVAAAKNVEFLDLSNQLEDREVCSVHTSHGTGSDAEWARFLVTGLTQGDAQESMHPNAYGQQATGTCLKLMYAATEGDCTCTNVAGASADTMLLSPG